MAERRAECSPTPANNNPEYVDRLSKEAHSRNKKVLKKPAAQLKKNRNDREKSTYRDYRENLAERRKHENQAKNKRRKINTQLEQTEEPEMQAERDVENENQTPRADNSEVKDVTGKDIPHRAYLESCFRKQIGLEIEKPKRTNIYSFRQNHSQGVSKDSDNMSRYVL